MLIVIVLAIALICLTRTGTGDHGKKSSGLYADPPWAQPCWSERHVPITADTVKLIVKEGMTPDGADKFLFNLAPFIAMIVAMLILAPIAFAKDFQIWDLNIGVLYVSAISSLSVIGILMAGWASNNKYSLLGAMRSGAQIVSYELSAGLSIYAIVVFTGSLADYLISLLHRRMAGGFLKVIYL